MTQFKMFFIACVLAGCGGAIQGRRGDPRRWEQNCADECVDPYDVRILERNGSESRTKIGIISISPPYVCRCD